MTLSPSVRDVNRATPITPIAPPRVRRGWNVIKYPPIPNAMWAYRKVLEDITPQMRWLDLGCGWQLLPEWMPDAAAVAGTLVAGARRAVGIDGDLPAVAKHTVLCHRVNGDLHTLPFRDGSFDLITANMVAEHLTDPDVALAECARILAPGGRLLIHTPNRQYPPVWVSTLLSDAVKRKAASRLERRAESDVYPAHYRLNTPGAMRAAARHGLRLTSLRTINSGLVFKHIPVMNWLEWTMQKLMPPPTRSNMIAILTKV